LLSLISKTIDSKSTGETNMKGSKINLNC
jgi:type VI secretion system secreted protein VgrG